MEVVGIDNDMRAKFFGAEASTEWNQRRLETEISQYSHHEVDIRDARNIDSIFFRYGRDVSLVVHAAAQPSHDWAANDPTTDFTVKTR